MVGFGGFVGGFDLVISVGVLILCWLSCLGVVVVL